MRRAFRWLVRIVAGAVVAIALIGAAGFLWIGSDAGRAWVRDAAARALGEAFGAQVEMASLARTGGLEVAADRLDVTIDGRPFVTAERVVARPAFPSLWPPVLSLALEVSDFEVRIGRGPDGRFDVERLDLGSDESEGETVDLDQIRFDLARGRVRLEDVAAETIVFRDIGGAGEVVWKTPTEAVLQVERIAGRAGELALGVHGDLDLDDALRFRAEVSARGTPGEDLARIAGVAADAEIDAHASGAGTFDEPSATVDVASGDAKLSGKVALAPGADGASVLDASWTLARVDPARFVSGVPAGELSGEGTVTLVPARGADGLRGEARLRDSELAGVRLEHFTASARTTADRVALEVNASAPASAYGIVGTGAIGLAPPYPTTFQADLSLEDASALPGELAEWLAGTRVRGKLEVDARRPIAPDREATARLELLPGEVRRVPLSRATARADLQGDLLQIGDFEVVTPHTRLRGSGRAELVPAGTVEARVAGPIDVRLVPGIDATGVVDAELDVSGRAGDLNARAHVASPNRVATPALSAHIDATAELRGFGTGAAVATLRASGDGKPLGGLADSIGDESRALALDATWMERPEAKASAAVRSSTRRTAPPPGSGPSSGIASGELGGRVEASFAATEPDGRDQRIALTAVLGPQRSTVELRDLEIAPRRGAIWRLARPARIVLAADAIEMDGVAVESRDGEVSARGALRRGAGKNDLEVSVRGVDLALACRLAGVAEPCSGPIDLTLSARGTGAAPLFDGRLAIRELRIDERQYGELNATLHADRRLRVDVALGDESAPDLRAEASVGLSTGGIVPTLDRRSPLEARARADALPLDALIGFTGEALRDLDGRARVDVRVGGTLDQPRLDGSAAISGLLFAVTSTGATYRDGTATLLLTSDEIRLAQLDLADGSVRGGGVVKLKGGLPDVLDLWLELEDAPILARPQADARGSGRFILEGTMEAPRLAGDLVVSPATIRPTLAAGGAGPPPDPTITVIRGDEPATPDADDALGQLLAGTPTDDDEEEDQPPPPEPQLLDRLAIRVTIAIGKRVVVQRTDAHLRLTGQLEVTKVPGGDIQVVGAIESENGWYLFQGRRVEIERAALRFGGQWPIDPALDVSAAARSGGYEVDIEIHGTLSEPTLNLSSSPPLDQGDILSVLLFGRPASQLSGGQGELLQRQGLSVLANYVAPELQRSLMDTLGLAAVTFSMPTGDRAGTVGVGRYFGNDLFVSLAQDFGGPKGGTQRQLQGLIGTSVTIQYSLTPSITLQTASSTEGESSVDVIWHRRY